jgi:DNA-directed RNA polymerase specialized sigma24 family protein
MWCGGVQWVMADEEAVAVESKTLVDAEIYAVHSVALVRFAAVLVGADAAQDVVSSAVLRSLSSRHCTRPVAADQR